MATNFTSISCGIMQLYDLTEDAKELVKEALNYWMQTLRDYEAWMGEFGDGDNTKSAIFSDQSDSWGEILYNYIKKHNLGIVTKSQTWLNTSGNWIVLYHWIFDFKAMWEHIHGGKDAGVSNSSGSDTRS